MGTNQASAIIRLGALIIPIIILFVAGQALRFDPNRRVARPSQTKAAIHDFERPWGWFFVIARSLLILLLVLDVGEIALRSVSNQAWLAILPRWAVFQNPSIEAIYATLALFAIWMVRRLKYLAISTFDEAFETHLDFSDWRTVDIARDSQPALRMGRWRYQMKWRFKTHLDIIDVLQMRMLIDCPTFAIFEEHVLTDTFPPGFASIMQTYPYGRFVGSIKQLMEANIKGLFQTASLWAIWEDEPHPTQKDQFISTPHDMAVMLYDELRLLLLCSLCQARPSDIATCTACHGTGTKLHNCADCQGKGHRNDADQPCSTCRGLGLAHNPIPLYAFLNRLQYLWMARNLDFLKGKFHIPLSNRAYFIIFGGSSLIFLIATLLFQPHFTVELLVQTLLFGSASLFGSIGAAIVLIFNFTFNSSGTLITPYPARYTKLGNNIWMRLRDLVAQLTFGMVLIDTTFIMSQFLFEPQKNTVLVFIAAM